MKHFRTIILLMAFFVSNFATAQDIETKMTKGLTINGANWTKVLKYGDPVTIFAYRHKDDTHTFCLFSDDYVGEIDMIAVPFDVDIKQLKKLPKPQSKKAEERQKYYYGLARLHARNNAVMGKYKIIASKLMEGMYSVDYGMPSIREYDTITIYGYKETRDILGSTYYFSIVKNGAAGIYKFSPYDIKLIIKQIPLYFLPSTDDSQVKGIIGKERSRIIAERQEKENKEREEKAAQKKALEEEEFADLKLMDPAYIEVKKIKMDSAGGNEVTIKFTNCSSLRIKYVYFTGYFLNAVGDKCRNEINRSTVWKYTGVGPISRIPNTPDRFGAYIKYFHSDPLFYSKTARKFVLSSVTIEYMNGIKKVLTGDELDTRVDYDY